MANENLLRAETKPGLDALGAADIGQSVTQLVDRAGEIILGKEHSVRLALACLIARGHLLIEDQPGVGKTTLAHLLARLLGLKYQRIQFTSDLLPADIIGVSIYDRDTGGFRFHPGPIFAQLILADEINRATPKTQSALLEVLEEEQVTADGETHPTASASVPGVQSDPSMCELACCVHDRVAIVSRANLRLAAHFKCAAKRQNHITPVSLRPVQNSPSRMMRKPAQTG